MAALAALAGCSADVTRFSLLGGGPQTPPPPASTVTYAPAGRSYAKAPEETALPPLKQPQDYRVVGRDYPPADKGADRSPWSDKDRPPWTDADPLPGTEPKKAAKTATAKAPIAPRIVQTPPRVEAAPPQAKADAESSPLPQKTARNEGGTITDVPPQPAAGSGRFRWPARGKMISGFGRQPDGSKTDGINLALPQGADIHAADSGRVHYAGDGLKGYGNLILIRHANGWTSLYAHADKMLVKAGDEVRRGQVIAKAGKTGPVAQPQLHFELRKGSVPVDPLPHLTN